MIATLWKHDSHSILEKRQITTMTKSRQTDTCNQVMHMFHLEQRGAARSLAEHLKERFMYL